MEPGEVRRRFGRCPYCRAMIYQDPEAVIYYCSKCRTPIRGKNPEPPTEDMDHALSRLEILSADSASVFSDDLDACHKQASVLDVHGDQPPLFSNPILTANSRDDARVYSNGHDERRPLSRRTRSSACSDSFVLSYGVFMSTHSDTEEGFSTPRHASRRQCRRSLVGLQEMETSRLAPSPVAPSSPLTDPAFQRDLLRSLESLRGLIAAIEPASSIGARAGAARRGARFFRQLESHLAQALPARDQEHAPRWNAGGSSTGLSRSSSASSTAGGRSERRKQHHCRPVLGGAPFLVCGSCSELLQVPAATLLSRRKVARLWCGGCEEVLQFTAHAAGVAGSASQQTTSTSSSALPESDPGSCNSSVCAGGGAQPLHRALGYRSPSPLLQSRRY